MNEPKIPSATRTMRRGDRDLFSGKLIRLAAPRSDDAAIVAAWTARADYLTHVDSALAIPKTAEECERKTVQRGNSVEFRIRRRTDDLLVGFVALFNIEWNNRSASLAIGVGDPAHRRKGYGREATSLAIAYAFTEANLGRLSLDVIAYNRPALGLYLKAGFREEGRRRDAVWRQGQFFDVHLLGLLRNEWNPS